MPTYTKHIPKLLAICADDFGLARGIDDGITQLAMAQRITAVSCMTNAPCWDADASRLSRFPGSVGVGLHFNLTEGRPLSPELARLWPRLPGLRQLMLRAHLGLIPTTALAHEFQAQWMAFCHRVRCRPMFVDGHQHVHQLPGIRDAMFMALDRMQVRPAVRSAAALPGPRYAFKRWLIRSTGARRMRLELDRRALAHNSCLLGVYDFHATDYRGLMRTWMASLPSPGGLLHCHPGMATPERTADPIAAARVRELTYLAGDDFPRDLADANTVLVRAWL